MECIELGCDLPHNLERVKMKDSNRRSFLISGFATVASFAVIPGFLWSARALQKKLAADQSHFVLDGSQTITVHFENVKSNLDENFPQAALNWYDRERYVPLCKECGVQKITTEIKNGLFIVHLSFDSYKGMRKFAHSYRQMKISDSQTRRSTGIYTKVFYRV
jgi:hypothetical protein